MTKKEKASIYNEIGLLKCKIGESKEAIKEYDKAIKLNPDFVEAYYNRCVSKLKINDIKGADKDHMKYNELRTKHLIKQC